MTRYRSINLSACDSAPASGAVRLCVLAAMLAATTMLVTLPVAAQTANGQLRGTNDQSVGGNPAILLRPIGTTAIPGQLLPGQTADEALATVTATPPDEDEEADAQTIPQSRVGPTQAFADDDPQADDPFGGPMPDPAEPLTQAELEEERLARLRRARAVEPLQSGPEVEPDENPYAAVGIQLGSFTLRPTIDIGIASTSTKGFRETGTTPPQIVSDDNDGVFGEIDFGILASSNWTRHSLTLEGSARFQEGLSGDAEAEPEIDLIATGRLDINAQTTLTGELGYTYVLEDATSSSVINGDTEAVAAAPTPSQQTIEGLLTLSYDTGGYFADATIGATRTVYGSVELEDGSAIEQSDIDNTLYTARLRGGFRASPVFRPFVEGQVGWRRNDAAVDSAGIARDSQQYALRLGTELDFGEKLTGEVAVGYIIEDIDDASLGSLGGVSFGADLDWSPRRGTQVALGFETTTQPSGLEDVSGAIVYAADATVTQQIRRNLSATLSAGIEHEAFIGLAEDTTTATAGLGFTYWFNRGVGLVGNYTHEQIYSDDPSQEQTSNSVFLGLRLQR